jgi:hypothetical protein
MTPTTAPAGVKEAIAIIDEDIHWRETLKANPIEDIVIGVLRKIKAMLQSLPAPVQGDAEAVLKFAYKWYDRGIIDTDGFYSDFQDLYKNEVLHDFELLKAGAAWQSGQQAAGEKEFITNAKYTPETCPYTHDPNLLTVAVCNHCGFKPHGPNPPKTNQP